MQLNRNLIPFGAVFILLVLAVYGLYTSFFGEKPVTKKDYGEYPLAQYDFDDSVRTAPSLELIDTGTLTVSPSFKLDEEISELPYYQYDREQYITEDKMTELMGLLDIPIEYKKLVETGGSGKVGLADDGKQTLAVYFDTNYIDYLYYGDTPIKNFEADFNPDQYENIAREIVDTLAGDPNYFQYDSYAFQSVGGYETHIVNSPYEGNYIQYTYKTKLNEYQLVDAPGTTIANAINILIDTEGNVKKIDYQPFGKVGENLGVLPIKSKETLQKELFEQKAVFVSGTYPLGENLASTVAKNAHLAYYAVGDKLLPVYIIMGDSITEQNNSGRSFLILEAVDKSYYD